MLRKLAYASLLACPLAALAVEPGEWELTILTVMTGAQKPVSASQKKCFTQADARDPSRMLSSGTCEFTNKNDAGGKFSFDVACTGPLPMQGTGQVVYSGQAVEGQLDLHAKEGPSFQMQTLLKGRRLGPC